MHTTYLSLGTNLGDRLANLGAALRALTDAHITITARSQVYETPPWGYTDQPPFLNMAVAGQTELPPLALLDHLKTLEKTLGRTPSFRYGPRQIDLDILFYDDLVLETERLTLPHPRLHERAFVLVPLAEIAPNLMHPRLQRTIRQLLDTVQTTGIRPLAADI